jgi:ELWxxDGT repeat protein
MVYDGSLDSATTLALVGSSNTTALIQSTGTRLFIAGGKQNTGQRELWISDGTPTGTTMVKKIVDGAQTNAAGIQEIITVGNNAVLVVSPDGFKKELWVSDGTDAGTAKVLDLGQGTSPITDFYRRSAMFKGKLHYFIAKSGSQFGDEIYSTDGTVAGTVLVATGTKGERLSITEMKAGDNCIYLNGGSLYVYTNGALKNLRMRKTGYEKVYLGAVIKDQAYFTVKTINVPNNDSIKVMRMDTSSTSPEILYTNDSMTINNYYTYGDSLLFVGNDNGKNQVFISKDVNGVNQTFRLPIAEQFKDYNISIFDETTTAFETHNGQVFFNVVQNLFKIGNEKNPVMSIFNQSKPSLDAKLYPNPASNTFSLSNIPSQSNVSIYSLSGQLVLEQKNVNSNQLIDTGNLENGIYLVQIQHEKGFGRVKLVISK